MIYQLPRFPLYVVKGNVETPYTTLKEASEKCDILTYNPDYIMPKKCLSSEDKTFHAKKYDEFQKGAYKRPTVFKEIHAIVDPVYKEIGEWLFTKREYNSMDASLICKTLLDYVTECLEETWLPYCLHIMPHSSGYDSRIVSKIIKNLHDKNGDSWLGDIKFIAWKPEIEESFKSLKEMGWHKRHFIPLNEDKTRDYFAEVMDFVYLGDHTSEATTIQPGQLLMSKWIDENIEDKSNIQLISATGSIGTWNRRQLPTPAYYTVSKLTHMHNMWAEFNSYLLPFYSLKLLKWFVDVWVPVPWMNMKQEMMRQLGSTMLDADNYRFEEGMKRQKGELFPHRVLSYTTLEKMQKDYDHSWYGRNINPNNELEGYFYDSRVNESFFEYGKAAVIESIVRTGKDVRK